MTSKLSMKNDINFKPLLPAAGIAEWISHSTCDQRVTGSKPPSELEGESGKKKKRLVGIGEKEGAASEVWKRRKIRHVTMERGQGG